MSELVPTTEKPQPGLEIATTGDGRDITRPYAGGMLIPTDRVLQGRGGGDLLIYEQVLSDPQVKACFEQRRNAVTSCEWQVDAGGDRPIDKKAADHAEEQIKRIGFDNVTDKMLYGVFYGYGVAELVWNVQGGLLGWDRIKVRNRRRFLFDAWGKLRLITPQKPYDGEPADAPYFWHVATGADHDDEPYGIGLAHWCYWPALFKRNGIAFWLTFLEKFAAPTAVGHFPSGSTPAEINRLLGALSAIRTDSAIALPDGMTAELLEAARNGTADYKVLHDTMDEAVAKAVLGQTMTTDNGSSKAQAEVHMDVRQDIVKADADLVCESFNLGPLRWLTEFNFPGAALPRVFRVVDEPEDLETIAKRDKAIADMTGFVPRRDYIHDTYGDHWEPKPEAVADPSASIDPNLDPAEFADTEPMAAERAAAQERLDALLAGAAERGTHWRGFVEPMVQQLQVQLDEADDLVAFRERLEELADAQPNPELVTAIARSTFGAWLLGRSSKEK